MWLSTMISVGTSVVCRNIFDSLRNSLRVIGVADPCHIPAIGKKAGRNVVAKGEIGMAFDRDAIAVVDPAEVAKHQMARERGGFAGDALHHIAVAAHRINVVVEHRKVGPIEVLAPTSVRRSPCRRSSHSPDRAARLSSRRQ